MSNFTIINIKGDTIGESIKELLFITLLTITALKENENYKS